MGVEDGVEMEEFEFSDGDEFGGECGLERGEDGGFLFIGDVELAGAEAVGSGVLGGSGFAFLGDRPGGTAGVGAIGFDLFWGGGV